MATVNEKSFVRAYLNILAEKNIVLDEDYVADISTQGPRPVLTLAENFLPPMKSPFNSSLESEKKNQFATLNFKTLRPPHFKTTLKNIPLTDTLFTVKKKILKENPNFNSSLLKFLVLGKVIPESRTIKSIVNDDLTANIMIMVTPITKSEEKNNNLIINQDIWTAIENVVADKTNAENAKAVVGRLKKGWDLC